MERATVNRTSILTAPIRPTQDVRVQDAPRGIGAGISNLGQGMSNLGQDFARLQQKKAALLDEVKKNAAHDAMLHLKTVIDSERMRVSSETPNWSQLDHLDRQPFLDQAEANVTKAMSGYAKMNPYSEGAISSEQLKASVTDSLIMPEFTAGVAVASNRQIATRRADTLAWVDSTTLGAGPLVPRFSDSSGKLQGMNDSWHDISGTFREMNSRIDGLSPTAYSADDKAKYKEVAKKNAIISIEAGAKDVSPDTLSEFNTYVDDAGKQGILNSLEVATIKHKAAESAKITSGVSNATVREAANRVLSIHSNGEGSGISDKDKDEIIRTLAQGYAGQGNHVSPTNLSRARGDMFESDTLRSIRISKGANPLYALDGDTSIQTNLQASHINFQGLMKGDPVSARNALIARSLKIKDGNESTIASATTEEFARMAASFAAAEQGRYDKIMRDPFTALIRDNESYRKNPTPETANAIYEGYGVSENLRVVLPTEYAKEFLAAFTGNSTPDQKAKATIDLVANAGSHVTSFMSGLSKTHPELKGTELLAAVLGTFSVTSDPRFDFANSAPAKQIQRMLTAADSQNYEKNRALVNASEDSRTLYDDVNKFLKSDFGPASISAFSSALSNDSRFGADLVKKFPELVDALIVNSIKGTNPSVNAKEIANTVKAMFHNVAYVIPSGPPGSGQFQLEVPRNARKEYGVQLPITGGYDNLSDYAEGRAMSLGAVMYSRTPNGNFFFNARHEMELIMARNLGTDLSTVGNASGKVVSTGTFGFLGASVFDLLFNPSGSDIQRYNPSINSIPSSLWSSAMGQFNAPALATPVFGSMALPFDELTYRNYRGELKPIADTLDTASFGWTPKDMLEEAKASLAGTNSEDKATRVQIAIGQNYRTHPSKDGLGVELWVNAAPLRGGISEDAKNVGGELQVRTKDGRPVIILYSDMDKWRDSVRTRTEDRAITGLARYTESLSKFSGKAGIPSVTVSVTAPILSSVLRKTPNSGNSKIDNTPWATKK